MSTLSLKLLDASDETSLRQTAAFSRDSIVQGPRLVPSDALVLVASTKY